MFGNTAEELTSRSYLNSSRFHRNTYAFFIIAKCSSLLKVSPKRQNILLPSHRVFPRSVFLSFQFIQIKSICQCVFQYPKSFLLLFFDIVSNFSNLQYISYSFTQSYSFHSVQKSNLFHHNPLFIPGSKGLVNNIFCVILIGPSSLHVDKLPLQYTEDFVNLCYSDKIFPTFSIYCSKHLSETIICCPSLHTFHSQNQFLMTSKYHKSR